MTLGKRDKNAAATPKTAGPREIPVGGDESEPSVDTAAPDAAAPEADPLEVLKARVTELEDLRLRALAEVDNTRKRMNRQMDDMLRAANDRLLIDLLEVVDNFDRALKHANGDGASEESVQKTLQAGMELIYNQMMGVLGRYEVRPMESVGRVFDPTYHEALAHVESAEYGEGTVTAEINRGYMIGARVLRHARVVVSKGALKTSEAEPTDD